ncbi:MAG TPA: hypothetical protein VF060_00845 [Trebonia sp.]
MQLLWSLVQSSRAAWVRQVGSSFSEDSGGGPATGVTDHDNPLDVEPVHCHAGPACLVRSA